MKKIYIVFALIFVVMQSVGAQKLRLPARKADALTGTAFSKSIADSTMSLSAREQLIYQEVKNGNIPDFLRKLSSIAYELNIDNKTHKINMFTLPDYFAIGANDDYFYVPMTPMLAQRIANLLNCSLPTKKMVDLVYEKAKIRLAPSPIPPTKAMTTVPVFIVHNGILQEQLIPYRAQQLQSQLTSGNKKDIIISNKIYTEQTAKVVIYGWHQLNGKPIQPVYNKHLNTWADYSHGARFIQNRVTINRKKTTLQKVLSDPKLCILLSDEGIIEKPYYPLN
ncbi:MAG: hypothetical protein EOO07_04315 [Chitinophagaceae bacterium]|nr:MAG: hypothetical protein EOO07_04315 [Chitinophagaceae bacterium]